MCTRFPPLSIPRKLKTKLRSSPASCAAAGPQAEKGTREVILRGQPTGPGARRQRLKSPLDPHSAGGSTASVVSCRPPTPQKEPETSENGLFRQHRAGRGLWRPKRAAGRAADPPVHTATPSPAPGTPHPRDRTERRREQAQQAVVPGSRAKVRAQPSQNLPPGADATASRLDREEGGPQEAPKGRDPPKLPPPRQAPLPQPDCGGPGHRGPPTPEGNAALTTPLGGRGWGVPSPGAAPPPPPPHLPQNLTMGPRGISSEASLGLPQHTLPQHTLPRRPPPHPPSRNNRDAPNTHTPLRWEWNSLKHPSTLREPAPASYTSPAPRGVRIARAPPRRRMVLPAPPQLCRNTVPPRTLQRAGPARHLPTHTHPPLPPRPGNGRVQPAAPPRSRRSPTPGGSRTMAGRPGSPLPLLGFLLLLLLLPGPPSASSPAALPCLLPRDRRPPTRKCPGATPAAAAMETLPEPAPPSPAPSHRADPPPPPSWTHNEARRSPTPPCFLLPPPPS